MGAGRGGAERADRAGGVEAQVVMPGPQRRTDAAGGLVTGDKGGDDLMAGALPRLGERQQAGQDRHGGMPRHRQIDVVVIERVADRAIDQRGGKGGEARLMADDAGLRRAAGLGQLVEQELHQLVTGPGDRHAEIVENALPSELVRLGR